MSDAGRHVSLGELEAAFAREFEKDKRAAAEIAYALAFRYRGEDIGGCRRFDLAGLWARRAIEILDSFPSNDLGAVLAGRQYVGGVALPELLHADIVRRRLADVLV